MKVLVYIYICYIRDSSFAFLTFARSQTVLRAEASAPRNCWRAGEEASESMELCWEAGLETGGDRWRPVETGGDLQIRPCLVDQRVMSGGYGWVNGFSWGITSE